MNKILILIGILIFSFVIISIPNNSFADNNYNYQGYYNKCNSGQGGMRLRAVTGEYRTMTCKEYATFKTTHKYPLWAWTNKNQGNPSGNSSSGYAPALPINRTTQQNLDRKLENERYKIEVRSRDWSYNFAIQYLSSISLDNYDDYMWKMSIESDMNNVINCVTKQLSHALIDDYNDYSSNVSDAYLHNLIGSNIELLLDVCTQ